MYVHPPPPAAPISLKLLSAPIPPGYVHWDKLRHLDPPSGFTHEEWWTAIRLQRDTRPVPLHDLDGEPFTYALPDEILRVCHVVDQRCAGEIASEQIVTGDEQAKRRYLVNALMEEAIRSSQLEGATTSRQRAKELLRSGREPLDRSERMILNNYRALLFMREQRGARLTPALVCELQRILIDGTLDDPDEAGRIQQPGEERVAVHDRSDPTVVLHTPPPAEQLPARLEALCAFANDDDAQERFVHPVLRAILVHFQLAYDHPFVDGNGRTARALFSWYLAKHGYWLIEYLSISRILREAPSQYSRSYLLTETDGGDTTYFLLHQLQTIERAIDDLYAYLRRKTAEIHDVEQLLHGDDGLNRRQLALLSDALREPGRVYTFGRHAGIHRITHETARADLRGLAARGWLTERTQGRRVLFSAPGDLSRRLQAPAADRG
ncbi:Fic family protein [Conexibacter sp. JD483]|uniref:Fic family protein n=1 Tax=unclassified Conexibacter TaxID=2627773 RepID=UPI002717B302|nr:MULTISPECIES: Fic family protein [unclassified Conexibacter]MDO8188803.1 Fic family protein [Conexibacter sp. CPCC 205706]MDO8201648.1 Fic family protein [Conexibacter sp. CPCC 205762]MDR9371332.1 Fic family protein [Conexibacter sp. JD483]